MNTKRFIHTVLLLLGIGISNIHAQSAKDTEFSADRTLRSSARINPSTLAVEFSLPLGSYPGRAGNSVPVSISYSSKVWEMKHFGTTLLNSSIKYRHNAIFSDKSASGWTSSMQPPRLKSALGLYNWSGEQYTPHYLSMMLMPEVPFEYNASQGISMAGGCWSQYEYRPMENGVGFGPYRVCHPSYIVLRNYSMGPYPQDIDHNQRFMIKRFYVTMPDGSSVEFRKDDNYYPLCDSLTHPLPGCLNNFSQAAEGIYLSVDGSGMRLQIDELQPDSVKRSVLYLSNGGKYIFSPASVAGIPAEKFIDVNGNETLFQVDQSGNRQTVDTLNRTIKDPFPDPWYEGIREAGTREFKLKGLGGTDMIYSQTWTPLKTPECVAVTTANCGESALEDDTQVLAYRGDALCVDGLTGTFSPALFVGEWEKQVCGRTRGPNATRFNPAVLTQITLPDGSKYKFKYNIYGEITRIDYPTGAYERFRYDNIAPLGYGTEEVYSQTNRGVVERWLSSDGSTADQHWTYEVAEGTYPSTDYVVKAFAPDGGHTERYLTRSGGPHFGFTNVLAGMPYDERAYDSNGVLRSRNLTEWITKTGATSNTGTRTRDPRVRRSVSILFDPNSTSALATMSETDYDETGSVDPSYFSHLNVKRKKGYHYAAVSKTSVDDEALSWTTIAGWFAGKLAAISEVDYSYSPDYRLRGIIGLPTQTRTLNPGNPGDVLSKSEPVYDEGAYFIHEGSTVGYQAPTGTNAHLRGNVTTSRTWVKESNTWLQTHTAYDNFGNARKAWDASGDEDRFVETEFSAEYYYAYPTKVISPAPDPNNSGHGTTESSSAEKTYDPTTGLVLSVKDDFGQVIKTEYNDPLLRPTRVYGENLIAPIAETIYDDTNRTVRIRKQIDESNWDEATTHMDRLGRAIKTVARNSEGDVTVETHYDQFGRVDRVTNPYRAGDTVYWSQTRYDEIGRAVESYAPASLTDVTNNTNLVSLGVASFGISTVTNYVGTFTTSVDASGRKGRSITNALGQLIRVDEPTATDGTADADLGSLASPYQPTYYKYDLYGNMVQVTQGVQNRYFKYSSLGRLIRVRQPEQEYHEGLNLPDAYNTSGHWTAAFDYDDLGNLVTAIDAKGVTTVNSYDRAGRVTTRAYYGEPDPGPKTPAVYFFYDGKGLGGEQTPNYAKGKLTLVDNSISQTRYKLFDNFGRLKEMEQRTPQTDTETTATATARVSKYTYNLSGALIKEEYPSGRKVQNEFESDGDIKRIYGKATSTAAEQTYANSFSYTPDDRIEKLKLGNGLWESAKFNNRLQPTEIALGHSVGDGNLWKITYEYGELLTIDGTVNTSKNIGNVARQTVNFSGLSHPFVQSYKYDALNRLTEARETKNNNQTWKQTFGYDVYGNRSTFTQDIGGNQTNGTPANNANTNRFTSTNFTYDKNGNITTDIDSLTSAARRFKFNAENKQIEVNAGSTNIGKYYYDGEGRRVKKVTAAETTIFVYSNGKLAAEYSTITPPSNPTINYTATDLLGSPRVLTDKYGTVISRRDFMPFGEELYADGQNRTTAGKYSNTGEDAVRKRFTGYEKDKETSLDFAEARYYNDQSGRFTTVDPLLASGKSANPQSFNRYVYVLNRPLKLTDPTGLQVATNSDGSSVEEILTTINTIWSNALEAINETLSARRDYLMNSVTVSPKEVMPVYDSYDQKNLDRFQKATNGYPSGGSRRLLGNKGPTIESIVKTVTEGRTAALKVAETSWAIQGLTSIGAGYTSARPSVSSNFGSRSIPNFGPNIFSSSNRSTGQYNYPVNNGFLFKPKTEILQPGTIIDRYGSRFGNYFSPEGTSISARSLPPSTDTNDYHLFEVRQPFQVQSGIVNPYYEGTRGFGTQYYTPFKAQQLVDMGILRHIP